ASSPSPGPSRVMAATRSRAGKERTMDKATKAKHEEAKRARSEVRKRTAVLRMARISPQKARLVADQVRGLPAERAVNLLKFSDKKAAALIKKLVESAIANARAEAGAATDVPRIAKSAVDGGPPLQRFVARARGRGTRSLKRTSHITVVVGEGK